MVNTGENRTSDVMIGARVRQWRKRRKMTQWQLAQAAGFGQTYISHIEAGINPVDRRSTQVALARALGITTSQLLGEPDDHPVDPVRQSTAAAVPAIRAALVELSSGERRTPERDLDQLQVDVVNLTTDRVAADYASTLTALPGLLYDLGGHGSDGARLMVETLFNARTALRVCGYADLALKVAELGVGYAQDIDDTVYLGQARFSWTIAIPPENAALGHRTAITAANELQGDGSRPALETYGMLHLMAGLQSAIALDGEQARAHIAEAQQVADHIGEPDQYAPQLAGTFGQWFGPTNMQLWKVGIAAELDDTATAVTVRQQVNLAEIPVPNRQCYYWIDLARALAADGGMDEDAMVALGHAERAAPQHFRHSGRALELVSTIIERSKRRAVSQHMALLANRLGLDPM